MRFILMLAAVAALSATPALAKPKATPPHRKACEDQHKDMYLTQQDGFVFAIGDCRAARGDIINRD
jgi:hypothetical protein